MDKNKLKEHQKQYYIKNKEKITLYNKKYAQANPERMKQIKQKWQKTNAILHQKASKRWRDNNKEHNKKVALIWKKANPERVRKNKQRWRKANPSSNRSYPLDLQDAMNNVRKRDNNTCQWQGCGLTHKQVPIHVHHIFPRNEYPDLELVEQYMICYCANHHGLWHRYRGDNYANFILRKSEIVYQRSLDFGNS